MVLSSVLESGLLSIVPASEHKHICLIYLVFLHGVQSSFLHLVHLPWKKSSSLKQEPQNGSCNHHAIMTIANPAHAILISLIIKDFLLMPHV